MARAEELNNDYYERSNTPNYGEFTGRYHFYDSEGRHYMLADKNKQTFQNGRLLTPKERLRRAKEKEQKKVHCVYNELGYIKIYVKLPSRQIPWFSGQHRDEQLLLHPAPGVITPERTYTVHLKSNCKPSPAKRRGTIFVKGLSKEFCNTLLNQ